MARLDELERKFEENPQRYFAPLANEYRKAGDAAKAVELCRSQLPEVPGHISGHIVLGQALYDAGDLPGSRAALEAALALDPENIVAMRYLGDIAHQGGDAGEAGRWYARTLEADPYNEAASAALQSLRDTAAVVTDHAEPTTPDADGSATIAEEPVATTAPGIDTLSEPLLSTDDVRTDGFEPTSYESDQPVADLSVDPAAETAEFAGDLEISAVAEPAVEEPAVEEPAVEEPAVEEPAASEEPLQTEERVLEAAAPFVTETMADLYLEQGYPHEALELLLQLAEQRPADEPLRTKIGHIESLIVARRDAAVAAARAERVELAGAAEAAEFVETVEAAEAPEELDAPALEPARNDPASVREMFARMDRVRPRAPSAVKAKPLSRLRSDFAPMPESHDSGSDSSADPFAFPNEGSHVDTPPAVARSSGPHPTFNPSTAEIEDFDAWLRGLRGP